VVADAATADVIAGSFSLLPNHLGAIGRVAPLFLHKTSRLGADSPGVEIYFRDSSVRSLSGTPEQSCSYSKFFRPRGHSVTLEAFYWAVKEGGSMTDREVVKQTAELLRGIIRSIDKKLEYSLMDQTQEGRFSLRLSSRGREGIVSLLTDDLRVAGQDTVRKNALRQKIKNTRDHLLSNYVVDVMGNRVAKMLKKAGGAKDESKPSFFRPSQGRRR